MRKFSVTTCALIAGLGMLVTGCGQVDMLKARLAFKDANGLYQGQDYRGAMAKYKEALELDAAATGPAGAYFFLANSADNLYRAARKGEPANDQLLTDAVAGYQKAAEESTDPKIKKLALEYLVAAYNNPDKLNDPGLAEPILLQMIELDPKDTANLFALAKIYEDSGNYEQAEQMLTKAKESSPNEPSVYMQLAGYYNRQGEFDKTIDALQQRAAKEPNNPEAHYTIATYYWDKAYRDFRLSDADKKKMVQTGVELVDKALSIKSDYAEAMVYKNLLLRLQANLEKDPARQQALLKQADTLRDQAQELRKKQQPGA
ncbi:MAG: tetratricopeptide repeat protein [Vicinamibacterales bacterium]